MDKTEKHSRENVWKMFDQISPRYDLINHLLSFGIDLYWRRQLIRHLPRGGAIRLLDFLEILRLKGLGIRGLRGQEDRTVELPVRPQPRCGLRLGANS